MRKTNCALALTRKWWYTGARPDSSVERARLRAPAPLLPVQAHSLLDTITTRADTQAVVELRELLLTTDEGKLCGKQLAESECGLQYGTVGYVGGGRAIVKPVDSRPTFCVPQPNHAPQQPAGEFGRDGKPEELVTDAHLRRWLVARDWNVEVTYKLLIHHGGWRQHMLPNGYISEVSSCVGLLLLPADRHPEASRPPTPLARLTRRRCPDQLRTRTGPGAEAPGGQHHLPAGLRL